MNEKSKYQNCPMCGSICEIESNLNEGAYRFVPVSDNAELQAENAELQAENAELRAFIEKVAKSQKPSVRFCSNEIEFINEARALLRGESEGK